MRYEFVDAFYTMNEMYSIEIVKLPLKKSLFKKYYVFAPFNKPILYTDSREELKIWLDLNGLKFKQALIKYKRYTALTKCIIYCEKN